MPKEIKDIFEETDKYEFPAHRSPKSVPTSISAPIAPILEPTEVTPTHRSIFKHPLGIAFMILLGIMILCVVALAVINYLPLLNEVDTEQDSTVESVDININVSSEVTENNDNSSDYKTGAITKIDSDKDGLDDQIEIDEYGTDPQKFDTDQDGLSDREEVKVYLTDPLDKDTDNDGFSDGDEVSKFYNPLGPGKLFDLEEEINNLNN